MRHQLVKQHELPARTTSPIGLIDSKRFRCAALSDKHVCKASETSPVRAGILWFDHQNIGPMHPGPDGTGFTYG
jgi:hypothetical protein